MPAAGRPDRRDGGSVRDDPLYAELGAIARKPHPFTSANLADKDALCTCEAVVERAGGSTDRWKLARHAVAAITEAVESVRGGTDQLIACAIFGLDEYEGLSVDARKTLLFETHGISPNVYGDRRPHIVKEVIGALRLGANSTGPHPGVYAELVRQAVTLRYASAALLLWDDSVNGSRDTSGEVIDPIAVTHRCAAYSFAAWRMVTQRMQALTRAARTTGLAPEARDRLQFLASTIERIAPFADNQARRLRSGDLAVSGTTWRPAFSSEAADLLTNAWLPWVQNGAHVGMDVFSHADVGVVRLAAKVSALVNELAEFCVVPPSWQQAARSHMAYALYTANLRGDKPAFRRGLEYRLATVAHNERQLAQLVETLANERVAWYN